MNIRPKRSFCFLALFFNRRSAEAPSCAGMRAFQSLRRQAKSNALREMSLAEINAEIAQTRNRRGK